ncbi:MAG: TetR/AcrR family transcriptional regulator [Chloroflexi bacterium]|nr:MAG: TetR/AcrR family transcriptional regulator [Chloroflexota bacterium]MBL1192747.1 TetR/AcrR family transcriptional regulator [Chloroflexota bacterium]NOH10040.1 TetR family transcriptional regulator [Chloroflexota bacterium]
MSTKELILQGAISLFNRQGTAKVSTNHIAEKAGISPGNLYYHYEDKQHIIREIYEQMIKSWESPYERAENRSMSIETLKRFIEENFELLWEYRFFYREMVVLLNADPALFKRHKELITQRFERQQDLLQQLEKDGIIHFPEPDVLPSDVLTVAWIVSNNYLVFLETMGQAVEYRDFEIGTELIFKVLRPYMV